MDDSILCAGNMNVPIGVCNGDSGGPLTYYNGTHTGFFFKTFDFPSKICKICESGHYYEL